MRQILLSCFVITFILRLQAQDTFSIVAVDTLTGEVGAAGGSCVDLFSAGITNPGFLAELFPGTGAIATQASYISTNQVNARNRMNAGDSPSQIISWLVANDVGANPTIRQYGIVRIIGSGCESAGYTGVNCMDYKNHIAGPNYCIQGNILLGSQVLGSMEARFNAQQGSLACKLMAALQGARIPGADSRCLNGGTSSLFSFLKVSQPGDPFASPSLDLGVRTTASSGIEPIDSLKVLFDAGHTCTLSWNPEPELTRTITLFPNPASNSLNVRVPETKNRVEYSLFKVTGEEISAGELSTTKIISLYGISNGFYILELRSAGIITHQKFVRKEFHSNTLE